MNRAHRTAALAAFLVLATGAVAAAPVQLAPFKDDLFRYPAGSSVSDGGDWTDVAYSEMRDINGRDEIPERRVKGTYVDPSPLRRQVEAVAETAAGPLKTMQVGERAAPKLVVLFVHGRNGDRRLGMYDRTFGGNFNRLKNLVTRADGLYATVDAGTFGEADKARVAAFVEALAAKPGRPPVVLACASMGGEFCWDLLARKDITAAVSGIVMLSTNNASAKVEAMRRAAGKRVLPLVIAHGTRDKVFAWGSAEAVYERLHREGYPARFLSMTDGNHGTPIRMIDWRDALNWILGKAG